MFEVILEEVKSHRRAESATVSHVRIEPRWLSAPEFVREFKPALFFDSFTEPRRTLTISASPRDTTSLIVEDTSGTRLADFQTIYEDMTERQQIDTKPPEYFETLISIFAEQKNASIFFCRAPRVALGCGTDHILRGLRHLLFGASMEAQRNVMAPYLLHFEIMRRAKAVGFKEYDFWGVAPENEPNESWYDISVFKRKFGGREVNLIPPLD